MQNSYDRIARQWHSQGRTQAYIDRVLRYVDLAVAGLPSGNRVLDLGCGTGQPVARYLVEKGFHVTGVDQSAQMLEIAKQEVPEAEFIHSDMINVQIAPGFSAAIVLFYLMQDGMGNRLVSACSEQQREFVAAFLEYLIEQHCSPIEAGVFTSDDILRAHEIWRAGT